MSSETPPIPPETLLAQAGWVRRLARRLVLDEASADDVVQQTWERALQRTGEPPRQLRPWLGGIIRNIVRHDRRGAARRAQREQAVAASESVGSTADLVARAEMQQRLVSMVLELEEPYRTTVLHRYFDGLSPAEIARLDGIPASTVRNRLSRALDQLRQRLDRESGERRAWSLLLVPIAALGDGPRGASLSRHPTWPAIGGGVLQVSTKGKFVAAAVGALLIAGALWIGMRLDWTHSDADTAQGPPALPAVNPTLGLPAATPSGAVISLAPTGGDTSAPTPAATSNFGTLAVEVVWAADGRPAADIELRAAAYDESSPIWSWTMPSARTDGDGRCTFEHVSPGTVFVFPDRTDSVETSIEAGKRTGLRIELPAALTVRGIVVDSEGRRVAGADVWLSDYFNSTELGSVVARSDNAGQFTIYGAGKSRYVGASAAGHGPSLLHLLRDAEGEVSLTIELSAPGGGVDGTVHGSDGSPVDGAVVMLFPSLAYAQSGELTSPHSLVAMSGPDGTFRFEDIPANVHKLLARGLGWSPWSGSVRVDAANHTTLDVVLQPSATVTGRVVDSSGVPVPGARVGVDVFDELLFSQARSGDDGGFVLRDVLTGSVTLGASTESGSAKTVMQIAPGETRQWEAVLHDGSVIRGRVLEADGQPAIECAVEAVRQDSPHLSPRSAMTDTEGRFTIAKCRSGSHVLYVHRVASWGAIPLVVVSDVVAGQGDVTISLPPADQAGGFIVGRVSLPADGVGGEGSVHLSHISANMWDQLQFDTQTGELHGGPYPAGTYRLRIECAGLPARVFAPVEVRAGATTDLGVIELAGPGRLTVHLHVEPGIDKIRLGLNGVTDPMHHSVLTVEGDVAHSGPLAEGEYRLDVSGQPAVASRSTAVSVHAGETNLDLTVERGARQHIAFEGLRPDAEWFQVRMLDDRGEFVGGFETATSTFQANSMQPGFSIALKRGHYLVELVLDGIEVLREPLDVTSLDEQGNWKFVIPQG